MRISGRGKMPRLQWVWGQRRAGQDAPPTMGSGGRGKMRRLQLAV